MNGQVIFVLQSKLNRKERLTADLDIFQDVGIGQCEGGDVFRLSQVSI